LEIDFTHTVAALEYSNDVIYASAVVFVTYAER
jgi:hypothetical protein